jgi:hypothetical protein
VSDDLGLRLTYQPGRRIVRAEAHLGQTPHWDIDAVRGGTVPKSQYVLADEFAVGASCLPAVEGGDLRQSACQG